MLRSPLWLRLPGLRPKTHVLKISFVSRMSTGRTTTPRSLLNITPNPVIQCRTYARATRGSPRFKTPPPWGNKPTPGENKKAPEEPITPAEVEDLKSNFQHSEAALKERFMENQEALENTTREQRDYFLSDEFTELRAAFPGAIPDYINVPPVLPSPFDEVELSEEDMEWYVYFTVNDLKTALYEKVWLRPAMEVEGEETPETTLFCQWLVASNWANLVAFDDFETFMNDELGELGAEEMEIGRRVYDNNIEKIKAHQSGLEEKVAEFDQVVEDGLRFGWLRPAKIVGQ